MPKYSVHYTTELSKTYTVEAPDELVAQELAEVLVNHSKIDEWHWDEVYKLQLIEEE